MPRLIRWVFLIHRYLGIAVGALMLMWSLSGVVMMYVSYPDLLEENRERRLPALDWRRCCEISDQVLRNDEAIGDAQVEMLGGRPVANLRSGAKRRLVDLEKGAEIARVSTEEAAQVAQAYAAEMPPAAPRLLGIVDYDQWTVAGSFDADRPLYRFALRDALGTEVYVSSITGRAVQITTACERFWNWLGSVPHWLYFAELRHRASLWSRVVVVTSLIGCFLVGTGIYIGVRQLIHRPVGTWSPYKGFKLWHHWAGLGFGFFALTWVLSGLLSMNPWGWLEGADARLERAQLRRTASSGSQLRVALAAVVLQHPPAMLSVNMAPLDGRLYLIATMTGGERERYGVDLLPAPLNKIDLAFEASALAGTAVAPTATLMVREDAYYFSHHSQSTRLPVYRIVLANGVRYYLDAVSGALLAKIDSNAQAYRWLNDGLHRLDFTTWVRGRPQWDVLMLFLLSGVTVLCTTGTYLGLCRLFRGGDQASREAA